MKINTILLKKKHIDIKQFIPSPKMSVNLSRINKMPLSIKEKTLRCELELNISIEDEKQKPLVIIDLNYIVIAILDDGDEYNQDSYANRLFDALQSIYMATANTLLLESHFPPLPLNIAC